MASGMPIGTFRHLKKCRPGPDDASLMVILRSSPAEIGIIEIDEALDCPLNADE